MGAEIANLLPSAGPSVVFIVVIAVLLRLWMRAERRADELARQRHTERVRLDEEIARRREAEDEAAKLKRKGDGGVDA